MTDINKLLQQARDRESQNAIDALKMSSADILKEIFICSNDHLGHNQSTRTSRSLAHFSALLIILSRQADESTKKIVSLTKTLAYLTWVIAVFTAILLFVTFFEVPKVSIFEPQKTNTST